MFFVYFHIIKLYSLVDLISNFSYIYCSVDSAWDKWSFKYNQIEGVSSARSRLWDKGGGVVGGGGQVIQTLW